MELRSGRMLEQPYRTVFKDDDERKKYLNKVIKDLLDKNASLKGLEKKIYSLSHIFTFIVAHKPFIWSHPGFRKFKAVTSQKATQIKVDMQEKITQGQLSLKSPAYQEATFVINTLLTKV